VDPDEIGVERDEQVQCVEKPIKRVTRKTDHQLYPDLEMPLFQSGNG